VFENTYFTIFSYYFENFYYFVCAKLNAISTKNSKYVSYEQ